MATTKGAKDSKEMRLGRLRWLRLAVQLAFLLLAPQAFSTAFAGARSIAAAIGAGETIALGGFVATLAVLCLHTIAFGRFFCGWACGFGMLGDVVFQLADALLRRLGRRHPTMSEELQGRLRPLRFVVLALMLAVSAAGASTVVGALSPWTAFGRLVNLQPAEMGVAATVLLVLLMVGMACKERFFCEFLCPLGAIFSLLPQQPRAPWRRDMGRCVRCAACQRSCPVGIYPPGGGAQVGECIQCGRCAQTCPVSCISRGTLPKGQEKPASEVSRRELTRAAIAALILLVLLWLVGSVSHLPASPFA